MSQAVQFSKVIAVESVVNPLKILFFMAARDSIRVQVSSHRVGAYIHKLESTNSFAGCEERHIDYMQHLPPWVPFLSVVPELIHDSGFGRVVLVEYQEAVVDDPSGAPFKLPVIHPLQVRIEPRHHLFKTLKHEVDISGHDTRVCLRDSFSKKADALMCPD